jgi:4'-phosphopantetheinyl transferase EntD
LPIGNDLIDLRTRDAVGKARDGRFVGRVFAPDEAARIASSTHPDRTLWMLWAAKEAAFKVARKLEPAVLFAHAAYEVAPTTDERAHDAPPTESLNGYVYLRGVPELDGVCLPVVWELTDSFIHCVAIEMGGDSRSRWTAVASHEELELGARPYDPTEREAASARTAESLAVRRLARSLAREAGLGDVEIVRELAGTVFGPPRLYRAGEGQPLDDWDLSLSHDGGLVAAALSGPFERSTL